MMKLLQETGDSCITARRSFIIGEVVIISGLLLVGVLALVEGSSSSRDIFLLLLIYAGLGGLHFLGRLSSLACPSKVLLAGLVFVTTSVSLNALLF